MKQAWKKIKSKIIHKNPWYSLREDDVVRPDGNEGKYYYVDGLNSVAIIAEDDDKKIFLVGQSRYPLDNYYSWEIITGGFKKGNNPLETAKRELKEETGLIAQEWIELGYYHPVTGYASEKTFIYLAKNLTQGKQELDPTEDITVKKESLENIIEMIKKNEIVDGLAIVAIYKYVLYINSL